MVGRRWSPTPSVSDTSPHPSLRVAFSCRHTQEGSGLRRGDFNHDGVGDGTCHRGRLAHQACHFRGMGACGRQSGTRMIPVSLAMQAHAVAKAFDAREVRSQSSELRKLQTNNDILSHHTSANANRSSMLASAATTELATRQNNAARGSAGPVSDVLCDLVERPSHYTDLWPRLAG